MKLLTDLYEHQRKCVDKLKNIKVGALYMEMGTGKTRATLELIKIRLEKGRINHVLWLCPCSVKETLRRDIIKHTGSSQEGFITICGIETLSSSVSENMRLRKLVEDTECYIIVDESNLVKNIKAKRTNNIIDIASKCKYKLILNGTPISRNEADLFAQWYILDWRILGYKSYWSFAANHLEFDENVPGKIVRCLNVGYLSKKISTYSYQVKKSECLDLPEKTYETEYYYLTSAQKEHYFDVADKLLFTLNELKPYTIYRFLSTLQDIISGVYVDTSDIAKDGTGDLKKRAFFKDAEANPRIEKLLEVINGLDDKAIIFCKYTQEIDDVCKVINSKYGENTAIPFNGILSNKERQKNIDRFRNDSRFLVANKQCGAYGLNLQFCNYVIYYSNDWDYATRAQSEDRVHRIGQDKNVLYLDICAANTLDERIIKCLERKEDLVENFKDELERLKDKIDLTNFEKTGKKNSHYRELIE